MRRFLSILLIALLLTSLATYFAMPVASADAGAISVYQDAYLAFEHFATQFPDRTVGTDYELAAANWLAQQLTSWGYTNKAGSTDAKDMYLPFSFTYQVTENYYQSKSVTEHSYNVVAYKRCGVEGAPLLVIAAPYSNEKSYVLDGETLQCEDAAYAASSVGALLSIAVKLHSAELSFDVAFAFLGAEYFYAAGTKEFLSSNTQSLLGAIYLSEVGLGDNLNVYYDEVDTAHGAYIDRVFAKWGYDIAGKPFDPGYYAQVYGGDLPYAHVGISGGNYFFMQQDVPTVHLFGYNWEGGNASSESAKHGDIAFTADDNLDNFLRLYTEDAVRERLNLAADAVKVLVLSDGDLAAALKESKAQPSYHGLVSNAAYYGLKYGLAGLALVVLALIAVLLMRRSKGAATPDFAVNSDQMDAEARPREDVFGEYGATIEGDSGDVDASDASSGSDSDDNNTGNTPDTNDIFGEF